MLRTIFSRFLFLLLGTALTFLGLEVAARVLIRLGVVDYWHPMKTVWVQGTDDWRLNHITADNLREPDPELFWKPVPRSPYNSQRFKGPLMAVPKPPEVFRILCYGDSNTDGPKQGSWPELLQEVLSRQPAPAGRRYEVINAGVAGYSSHQGLHRFRQEVETFKPDLVLVSFGWNDVAQAVGRSDHEFHPSWLQVTLLRALFKSRFYLVLLENLPLRTTAVVDQSLPGIPRVPLPQYIANMERFVDLAKRHGAAVLFLTRPQRKPVFAPNQLSSWRKKVPAYNAALRGWAGERGLPLFDVEALFDRLGTAYFYDECHLTKDGHRTLAEALAPVLSRQARLSNAA